MRLDQLHRTILLLKSRRCLFALVIVFAVAGCLDRALSQEREDVVRIESNLVQLNVGVVDHKGSAVRDLSASDFVVYEDNVRQKIVSFESGAAPFSLALLLDVSGSTLTFRQQLKQSALRFLEALGLDDRVTVIAFNEKSKTLVDFTSDPKKLAWAISIAEGKGGTELYGALEYALKQVAKETKRRKAIVVLTDGLDTQMRNADCAATTNATTNDEALAAVKPNASRLLNSVLRLADQQGVTIFPLALPSGDPRHLPLPSPQLTAIYSAARLRLETLANRTGGRLSEIHRLEDMLRLYVEVAADLRRLYTIAYQAPGERPRDGRWHDIRVEVARPDLIARTKPGYYAK
jgi:VWFA-related protein